MGLEGFTKHKKTTLVLPEKGIVLVTGKNGSGKSSVIEGVAYGLWGKTLRGTKPWQPDVNGEVRIKADGRVVARVWSGKRESLSTGVSDNFPTNTKAQEALEKVVGSFDVWRRSCVFSSSDAAGFTLATDGERKRLLESVLGLAVFDAASDASRADLRAAEVKLAEARSQEGMLQERIAGTRGRISDLQAQMQALPAAVDLEALKGRATKLRSLAGESRDAWSALRERLAARLGEVRQALELMGVAKLKGQKAAALTHCDRCEQEVDAAVRQVVVKKWAMEAVVQEVRADNLKVEAAELRPDVEEADQERFTLEDKLNAVTAEINAATPAERLRVDGEKQIAALEKQLAEQVAKRAGINTASLQVVVAELEGAVAVLGMKGVRAHVLGSALSGLEQAANGWLARVAGPGLTLKLSPYSEKKSGGVSDSISLEVHGAGGGLGYAASSGGERRRIDVALMLALGQIAGAAAGAEPGTMFFDEVFDALDEEGVDRAITVLEELAQVRTVIVISHSASVLRRLRAATQWTVEGGAVRES
jgi:DNA repair exonuclease SbcCD ATPase subunit